MKEKIIKFEKSKRNGKKYTAYVQDKKTKQIRKIHFGATGYQQFKDSTGKGVYSKLNHGDPKRKQRYFLRHSGTRNRKEAITKEKKRYNYYYSPKILSHIYLW